jgi:hypothetical protein
MTPQRRKNAANASVNAVDPIIWSCAQERCVLVSASAISRSIQKETRTLNAATRVAATAVAFRMKSFTVSFPSYHERIHHDQSNLIPPGSRSLHPNGLELLASDRYLQKAWAWMAP